MRRCLCNLHISRDAACKGKAVAPLASRRFPTLNAAAALVSRDGSDHISPESVNFCQRKNIFPTGLGASPCTKPIWDSSESSSQAEPFITNRPCSPSTPNVHCHRVHSISYLRQQMQRCISFPIPGNRCRTSGLYNCAVSPALGRTSSFSPTD